MSTSIEVQNDALGSLLNSARVPENFANFANLRNEMQMRALSLDRGNFIYLLGC